MSFSASIIKRPQLRLGYVPLADAAPLIVARELGFFQNYGLRVKLSREPGWASIRDKIVYRELDGAHAVAGMVAVIAAKTAARCLTALVLNSGGNAITLSQKLREAGLADRESLSRAATQGKLAKRPLRLGVVSLYSSHYFLMCEWLVANGLQMGRDARLVVLPPRLLPQSLEAGHLDGFCSGEPWNSVSVASGHGWIVKGGLGIDPPYPEKILLVSNSFAGEQPETHLALIAAIHDACAWCGQPENRPALAEMLALPQYLDVPVSALQPALVDGIKTGDHTLLPEDFLLFDGEAVSRPTRKKARWLLQQLGSAVEPLAFEPEEIFREDLYEAALSSTQQKISV